MLSAALNDNISDVLFNEKHLVYVIIWILLVLYFFNRMMTLTIITLSVIYFLTKIYIIYSNVVSISNQFNMERIEPSAKFRPIVFTFLLLLQKYQIMKLNDCSDDFTDVFFTSIHSNLNVTLFSPFFLINKRQTKMGFLPHLPFIASFNICITFLFI